MVHLRKIQWLAVAAVLLAVAAALASSTGLFSSQTLVITAVKYEGSLYIIEDGEISSVVPLSPSGQVVPEWTGTGFVFREMTDEELESRQALLEEVFSILLEDETFSAIISDSEVELLGLFYTPPSVFLGEKDKYGPQSEPMEEPQSPPSFDSAKPPRELVVTLRDMLPDFVFYRDRGVGEVTDLYALLSVDGTLYECYIDIAERALITYKSI